MDDDGQPPLFISVIGNDAMGAFLLDNCKAIGSVHRASSWELVGGCCILQPPCIVHNSLTLFFLLAVLICSDALLAKKINTSVLVFAGCQLMELSLSRTFPHLKWCLS